MSKHTPGPWRLCRDPLHFDTMTTVEAGVVGATKPFGVQMIVQVGGDSDNYEAEANTRLIAAAPDLLASLQELLPMWSSGIEEPWVQRARAAINKATGETNE